MVRVWDDPSPIDLPSDTVDCNWWSVSGIIATGDPSFMPLMNMTMEARDDNGAGIFVFLVKGKAGGEEIGAVAGSNKLAKVEIEVEEASTYIVIGILSNVRVGNEARVIIGTGGDVHGVPNRVLSDELLSEGIKHIPEEVHGGAAREGMEVMTIEVKVSVDDGCDVKSVEIFEDVGKDGCAVVEPGLPCFLLLIVGVDKNSG